MTSPAPTPGAVGDSTYRTDGLWSHTGSLLIRTLPTEKALVVVGGDVTLPVGCINTYELAVGAAQAMEAYYAQKVAYSLPVGNVWRESPIQATGVFEGFIVRVEFNFPVMCANKGQRLMWGVMVDGVLTAIGAIGGLDAPENGFMGMAVGTYYVDPRNDPLGAGSHRVGIALNGPTGSQILNAVASTLFLTEQKR